MGEFWHDSLSRAKRSGEHAEVLRHALDNLPLPAAFREAAIALRRLFKDARADGQMRAQLATDLYQLAIYHRFLYAEPTAAGIPAYNVAELAHEQGAATHISYDYQTIGLEQLDLLNKTDRKQFVKLWGKPRQDRDPRDMHAEVWREALDRWRAQEQTQQARLMAELRALLRSDQ